MGFELKNAADDWNKFIEIFNRHTRYAPYCIPLSREIVDNFIAKRCNENDYVMLGNDGSNEGIIHAGVCRLHGNDFTGFIYMLFADNNVLAEYLLRHAEEWLVDKNVKNVMAYTWQRNPYKFILHGLEAYAWNGAYPVMNAFRRLDYDIMYDIVVMSLNLSAHSQSIYFDMPDIELQEELLVDNQLAWGSRISLIRKGKHIGSCSYYWLKAISGHLKQNYGQFMIDIHGDDHGSGVARELLQYVHSKMAEKEIQKVILVTNQSLFRAIKFYEKLGYKAEVIRGFSYQKDLLSRYSI